jgi:hypothetical protein
LRKNDRMIPSLLQNRHTPCTDSESVLIKIVGDYVGNSGMFSSNSIR